MDDPRLRKIREKVDESLQMEDEVEGHEVPEQAAEDIEVGTTHRKIGDKRKCQLCDTEQSHPSEHIAFHHLKKHLFTCPVCKGYGYGKRINVVMHIKKIHPLAMDEQPVSHVAEHSAEMQRLQVICFPKLQLKVSRPPRDTRPRSTCVLCNEKVDDSGRQHHVFGKHFKKAGLFDCPLCAASRPTFVAVREHIKRHHRKEYGRVQPISHERAFEKEISALNEQCFPGWRRLPQCANKKRPAQKEDSESEEKREAEDEEKSAGSEEESAWSGAPKKCTKGTPAIKTSSKRVKARAEGEEGASGSGLH